MGREGNGRRTHIAQSTKQLIMKPIKFPEVNVTYAENQPEYQPLPVFKVDSPQGDVVSCWQLSFRERVRLLFTGKLWVCLLTFNKPLTPSYFTTKKSELITKSTSE
jgi:hypothetical protein